LSDFLFGLGCKHRENLGREAGLPHCRIGHDRKRRWHGGYWVLKSFDALVFLEEATEIWVRLCQSKITAYIFRISYVSEGFKRGKQNLRES